MPNFKRKGLELTTNLGRLKDIDEKQLACYDAVYIGDPFCELGTDNLLENKKDLRRAVRMLKRTGKKVYLSTYVEPWTDTIEKTALTLETAAEEGIDAVEVADLGILRLMARCFKKLDVHISNFMNCFNSMSAGVLSGFNVKRIVPYPELSLEEIDEIRRNSGVEIELQVHGKIPLGYTELCIIDPGKTEKKQACPGMCYQGYCIKSGQVSVQAAGRVPFGHKDLSMFNHISMLLGRGYRNFRIESRFERGEYRQKTGQLYREAINFLLERADKVARLNSSGVCNGFYFGRAGMEYCEGVSEQ